VKVLTIHNKYQIRGGEDESCDAESRLLVANGHEVSRLTFENDGITRLNASSAGLQAAWRHSSYKRVLNEVRTTRPDIVNVHNFFPVASPAVYYAARRCGVPVVQTLHNYRLLCPGAILFRDGKVCEECVGKSVPWPGVAHACYRASRSATLAVTSMLAIHNLLGTWIRKVDMFIALSEFSRRKFIEGGLPAERVTVKPNFLASDPGCGSGEGDYVLYVGRLPEEKGLRNLIDAWKAAACPGRLIIAGEGPLAPFVEGEASRSPSISFLGGRSPEQVYDLLADARALVFPSTWYEGMPRVIVEALSHGTPVIATRIGSMTEMISEGKNGWLVPPGDVRELAASIANVFRFGRAMGAIRASARRDFEDKYTAERNYHLLMNIYHDVIAERLRN
jgi:glycosyltransferase involved in cell wall biosynthesis